MEDGTRFLILALASENYALPITRLMEITVPRDIRKDPNLTELFEGKIEYRGKLIPVLNTKKVLKISGKPGTTLLVVKGIKGLMGLLVDAVIEIVDTEQKPVPLPKGVMNPSLRHYSGILRYKKNLVLLLNEEGLLP
jgi:purine-binding chemotaxis protein CheW